MYQSYHQMGWLRPKLGHRTMLAHKFGTKNLIVQNVIFGL